MEKYSQFRDKGSGVAPFLPIPRESSGAYVIVHTFLFIFRLPFILFFALTYFLFLSWLPVPNLVRKGGLWCILGTPGIWWIDLQIDGVKRGSLAKHLERLPQPGSIIASSFTSPLDCLYLAAIFDPVFTASYPNFRRVQQISLFQAIFRALSSPKPYPPHGAKLVTLASLKQKYPQSLIVVLPECTASNGRGILSFSPSLLTASRGTKVYPVNLRYSPSDVTTPLPGAYISFFWDLLSRPTHTIRVRIAESIPMPEASQVNGVLEQTDGPGDERRSSVSTDEQEVLDQVAEDLARLGRSKRVGLGVQDKVEFLKVWTKTRRIW